MRFTALLLALLAATPVAVAANRDAWYTGWPATLDQASSERQVSAKYITEIPHSLFGEAQRLLAKRSFLFVGNNYFPARIPACPANTKAYLVRALYEHGSTGGFEVYAVGTVLLVRHYALGPAAQLHRSALIVCLGFAPSEVYVATGGAMQGELTREVQHPE